jgi:Zn-dependent protease
MRLQIGSAFGIPVYLHWTLVLVPLLFLQGPLDSNLALVAAIAVPLTFLCVILHEFGHALVARCFGVPTRDITLYPIGGVARLEKMPEKPLEEFLIAIAGPAVNVVIALILAPFAILLAFGSDLNLLTTLVFWLLISNGMLVAFNLLPAFPMDGGRVLRAVLAAWLGFYRGTVAAVITGRVVGVLMALAGLFLFHNYMLLLIVLFVFFAGQQELMYARWREGQRLRREEMLDIPEVLPAHPLGDHDHHDNAVHEPPLILQPRVSVYIWDQQTGTWLPENRSPLKSPL